MHGVALSGISSCCFKYEIKRKCTQKGLRESEAAYVSGPTLKKHSGKYLDRCYLHTALLFYKLSIVLYKLPIVSQAFVKDLLCARYFSKTYKNPEIGGWKWLLNLCCRRGKWRSTKLKNISDTQNDRARMWIISNLDIFQLSMTFIFQSLYQQGYKGTLYSSFKLKHLTWKISFIIDLFWLT